MREFEYTHQPVVIQAVQWLGAGKGFSGKPDWLPSCFAASNCDVAQRTPLGRLCSLADVLYVGKGDGMVEVARPGDWLIFDRTGMLSTMRHHQFAWRYLQPSKDAEVVAPVVAAPSTEPSLDNEIRKIEASILWGHAPDWAQAWSLQFIQGFETARWEAPHYPSTDAPLFGARRSDATRGMKLTVRRPVPVAPNFLLEEMT